MIHFPKTTDEALHLATVHAAVYRAGGSDLHELRAHQLERAPLVDLRDLDGLDTIECDGEGARVGALTTLAAIATHPGLRAGWSGLADACGALATPQIRAVATLGGNLLQAPRCSYFRHPDYHCLRQGGARCYAREGDHLWHVVFDQRACAAPHPSTAATALLAYDAELEWLVPSDAAPHTSTLAEFLARERAPEPGTLVTALLLPPPLANERTAYVRASNRAYAEWALVEVSARVRLDAGGAIDFIALAAGAVASVPLRLRAVEDALLGQQPTPQALVEAARLATQGAAPLPMTAYKLELLEAAVLEAIERALAAPPAPALEPPPPTTTHAPAAEPARPHEPGA